MLHSWALDPHPAELTLSRNIMAKISFRLSVTLSEEGLTPHQYYLKWRPSQRRKGRTPGVTPVLRHQALRIPEIRSQETLLTDSAATLLPLLIQHTITTTTTPLLLGLRELLLLVDLVDLHHLDLPPGLLLLTLTIQA